MNHVRSVEIEADKKSTFEIALDGVPYGPFQKVLHTQAHVTTTLTVALFRW
jgi:hypothetical protein